MVITTMSTTTITSAPAAAPRLVFDPKWLIIGLCVGLTVYLGVVPLGFLLWQSFFTPQTAAKAAQFTFGNYQQAYGSAQTWVPVVASISWAVTRIRSP